jgi:preprotein translocase subunit SecF
VNISLNETLNRNLNTAVTTAVAILAVLLFGGPTIRDFMLVLLIGVMAGTYSSLFLAANILVSWDKGEIPRLRIPFLSRGA